MYSLIADLHSIFKKCPSTDIVVKILNVKKACLSFEGFSSWPGRDFDTQSLDYLTSSIWE